MAAYQLVQVLLGLRHVDLQSALHEEPQLQAVGSWVQLVRLRRQRKRREDVQWEKGAFPRDTASGLGMTVSTVPNALHLNPNLSSFSLNAGCSVAPGDALGRPEPVEPLAQDLQQNPSDQGPRGNGDRRHHRQ